LDPAALYSRLAANGPPLFFPDPPFPVTFNLDQGIPAEETFPVEDLKRLAGQILDTDGPRALEYISFGYEDDEERLLYLATYIELVLGYTGLRDELAKWMTGREGREFGADNFILASGSVQAIALAINAFVDPGDGVLVEDLERQILAMKADGVRPKLMYVIPTFQLPTCVETPLVRRERLLELAEEHEIIVLEDNIYGDLRYEGESLPTLLSLDRSGLVLQSHGFSKIVAPALRIGWVCGDEKMIEGLAGVRQDLGVSQWLARMMTAFMAEGKLDPHIEMVNDVYRHRRDIAIAAVREHCGDFVRFDVPQGGFYLWLELDEAVDWDQVGPRAAENGVMCRPGERFMADGDSRRFLRLAYSHAPEAELVRGIEALGAAIRSAAKAPAGN
jgi:2-aminoadipate transaminase